MRKVVMYIATS